MVLWGRLLTAQTKTNVCVSIEIKVQLMNFRRSLLKAHLCLYALCEAKNFTFVPYADVFD